ncbi:MAG: hypothetical protein DRR08_03250 [Candidatus Parabeggiatoa sp. nov. 2]|nr:MAG: hypothetical protein B6247_19930 [Beggiatoa sp. 4572_84]RKZ63535.1 MAG: hypothetical protein DRR08_03250 [Gammaproteobacteria bacterium]HEC84676.1 hypothetical protein [Thioploca sp.]
MSTIPVIVDEEAEAKPKSGTLGGGRLSPKKGGRLKHIDTDVLRASLETLSTQVAEMLQDIQKEFGGFKLKEVQLQVEVNAEGGVALIGTAKAGTTRGITLTFATDSDK